MLVAGSSVFVSPGRPVDLRDAYNWWSWVPGAGRHEVRTARSATSQIIPSCTWPGPTSRHTRSGWASRVPTEAEWEFAARGGLDGAEYAWGDEMTPGGQWMANTWQGAFPNQNTRDDGYDGTAPVGRYQPNGYGLFDMIGNVWEWTTGLVRGTQCGQPRLLHGAESAERRSPTQHRPSGSIGNATPGDEGRLARARRTITADTVRRPDGASRRHKHQPSRLPTHRSPRRPLSGVVGLRPDHGSLTTSPGISRPNRLPVLDSQPAV